MDYPLNERDQSDCEQKEQNIAIAEKNQEVAYEFHRCIYDSQKWLAKK